jgi:hypothetical protein
VAVGLIVLTATVALPLFAQRLARSIPFDTLRSVQQALQQDPDVRHASALVGVSRFFGKDGSAKTTHVLTSDVVLSRRVTDLESTANRMARIILDHDPSAAEENEIAISVRYGYDIGIASAWQGRSFSFSPEEWRRRF